MEFLVRGALEFGEPVLFVSFEESTQNLVDEFRSVGFDLESLIRCGSLKIVHVVIPREELIEGGPFSLDGLLIRLEYDIAQTGAKRVVLDSPETLFSVLTDHNTLRSELGRLMHWLGGAERSPPS
jgi:circadian clock protein KaiC